MRPHLLIRADAHPAIGVGHVMRMLALAEAWLEAGGAASLLGRLPEPLATRARAGGVDHVGAAHEPGSPGDAAETARAATAAAAAWVVADGYQFAAAWQREVRSAAPLLLVDDNAENAPYEADAVLNVNLHAAAAQYERRAARTRLLLGPAYALIRGEIRRAAARLAPPPARAAHWLVTMGGADPLDVTGRFLEAYTASPPAGVTLEVLVGAANQRRRRYEQLAAGAARGVAVTVDPPDVTVPMRKAELAFAASGGTVWELALLGVPCAMIVTADNQRALGAALADRGAACPLGDAQSTGPADWLRALAELAGDPQRRAHLVGSARKLVDGEGARRVVSALREAIA